MSHAAAADQRARRQQWPIEAQESRRWPTGLHPARALAQRTPATPCACMADGAGAINEVFAGPRGGRPVPWRIRACQDRALAGPGGQQVRGHVLGTPVLSEVELRIRGRHAKTAAGDRARRQNRTSRQAKVEVLAAPVALRPPARSDRQLPPVPVNVVLVREPHPPPVEWMLLTALPIDTPEQVRTSGAYDGVRRDIENFFRTLKSGGRIAQRRFEQGERVLPCLALCRMVARRMWLVCRMGRRCPDVDCQAISEPAEWKAVGVAVHRKRPPRPAPKLAAMVHRIASLGG